MNRRNFLTTLAVGGLIPFVRGDELQAAPQEEPQVEPNKYTGGSAHGGYRSVGALSGTATIIELQYTHDGMTWRVWDTGVPLRKNRR